MTTRPPVLFCLLTLLTVTFPPDRPRPQDPALGAPVSAERTLAALDWLAGNWSGDMWGGRFSAYYSTPAGGRILSYSTLVHDGQQSYHEFEVFEVRELEVHLQPFPGGQPADGGFVLAAHDPEARRASFDNPDKDYPTRIVYERLSDDELVITLSDPHGGSDKVERFELSR